MSSINITEPIKPATVTWTQPIDVLVIGESGFQKISISLETTYTRRIDIIYIIMSSYSYTGKVHNTPRH